jgi:transcriptional regulator of arginine metabolism
VTSKFERQGAILRLVREQELATQHEVAEALRSEGHAAVQATVSRDIAQLGLIKVRGSNGRRVYALPDAQDLDRLNELATALRRWATSAEASGPLLVLKTPEGFASALSEVIDRSAADVAGTIAGANTVFVAPRDGLSGAELLEQFRHHLEGDT